MKKVFSALALGLFLILSCQNPKNSTTSNEIRGDSLTAQKSDTYDSVFSIFNDGSYSVSFKVIPEIDPKEVSHKGTLTLLHRKTILLHDTLEFFIPLIELKDMNNDKQIDVLILNTSSARSVETFHLYITDSKNHLLKRVKDFEKVYDPLLDTTNNIIVSMARYSCIYYQFYRITKEDKLIELGNDFEDCTFKDSVKYLNAVKNILKENK